MLDALLGDSQGFQVPDQNATVKNDSVKNSQEQFVLIAELLYYPFRLVNFYLVRFWSPRRSGVSLTTTHKAGFFDPGGWHYRLKSFWASVTGR